MFAGPWSTPATAGLELEAAGLKPAPQGRSPAPRRGPAGRTRAPRSSDHFVPPSARPVPSVRTCTRFGRDVAPCFLERRSASALEPIDARRRAESHVHAQVVLRQVAAAATHLVHLCRAAGRDAHARPDRAAVRRGADQLQQQPPVLGRRAGQEQIGRVVHVADHDVDGAVVVDVAERRSAAGLRCRHRRAEPLAHVFEDPLDVAVHDLALLVAGVTAQLAHLGVHVPVRQEDVEPPVVVEVGEPGAPPEPPRVGAEAALERAVLAEAVAHVGVERRRVPREVGLHDVHRAVAVEVADPHAHARLRLAVLAEGAPGFEPDVLERPIAAVPIERARVRIVRHVQVDPPVVVEIERGDPERVGAERVRDAGAFGHVLEAAAAQVAVEDVGAALQAWRTAGDPETLEAAETRIGRRRGREIEVDVVGDEDVEPAVAVVVEERAPRVPAQPVLRQAGAGRDVLERAAAGVPEESVLPVVGDEQVFVPVVVVVAGARPLPPAPLLVQARRTRDVLEAGAAAVPVETGARFTAGGKALERRAVHEEEVRQPVVVVVEHRDAGARGLEQVAIDLASAEDHGDVEPGVTPGVHEREGGRRLRDERDGGKRRARSTPGPEGPAHTGGRLHIGHGGRAHAPNAERSEVRQTSGAPAGRPAFRAGLRLVGVILPALQGRRAAGARRRASAR
jgi:hypothetical protein